MKNIIYQFLIINFLFCFIGAPLAHSAYVSKVKGKKILISIKRSGQVKKGDVFYLMNSEKKKKALIKILKVKGKKALAIVRKGKAKKGFTLKLKRRRVSSQEVHDTETINLTKRRKSPRTKFRTSEGKKIRFGITGGMNLYNLHAKQFETPQGANVPASDLTGQGLDGKLTVSLLPLRYLQLDLGSGFKQFSITSAEEACQISGEPKSCETLIQYITGSVLGKFVSPKWAFFNFFIGGGYEFNFPLSKKTIGPYISEPSITTLGLIFVNTGLNLFIHPSVTIPLSFEYGLFPSSDFIKGTYMKFTTGILF